MVSNLDISIISWWYLLWISIKSSMVILTLAYHLFDLHEFKQRVYQRKFGNLNSAIQRKKVKMKINHNITTSPRHLITTSPHHQLFSDGRPKGQVFACGSDANFCQRIDSSGGTLMWMTDESVSCLDCDFLTGASLSKDAGRVDVQSILSCQNGGYGPKSIKSKDLK